MKRVLRACFPLLLLLLFFAAAAVNAGNEKARRRENVLSFCYADIDGDGTEEMLAVETDGSAAYTADGERLGNSLTIYRDGQAVLAFDLSYVSPLFVQTGDVNRDGVEEICLIVYKETQFHPVPAKRPFFYALSGEELKKVWLGSRLSRPFTDFVLFDIDGDGFEEILAVETNRDLSFVLAVYRWEGFGFDMVSEVPFENPSDGTDTPVFCDSRIRKLTEVKIRFGENIYTAEWDGENIKLRKMIEG